MSSASTIDLKYFSVGDVLMTTEAIPKKFGPARLVQGVTARNMFIYYFATVASMLLFTFLPQFQPFILTETLRIPESQQGVLSGNLAFFAEIVILLSISVWGTLSDKAWRRLVFASGFLIMAVVLLLYLGVQTIPVLFLYRGLFALGSSAATTMIAICGCGLRYE